MAVNGTIGLDHTRVTTGGYGAIAQGTGQIRIGDDVALTVTGGSKVGLAAQGAGRITTTAPVTVTMTSTSPQKTAVYMHDGGQVALAAGSQLNITAGVGVGLAVDNSPVPLNAPISSLTVNLNGSFGNSGVVAMNGGTIAFDRLTVGGSAAAGGVRSRNAGSRIVLTGDSRITIVGSSPNYYEMTSADFIGDLSTGFTVIASTPPFGLEAELGGQIDATGATINVSSQSGAGVYGASQGTVNLNNVTVETTGEFSNGAFVNNATINGVDSRITVSGANIFMAALRTEARNQAGGPEGPGVISLTNSTVLAKGPPATATSR